MDWSTTAVIKALGLFVCKRLPGLVENLIASKVWPYMEGMDYWSITLLIVSVLIVPSVVFVSDRVRKEHRRSRAHNQISETVTQIGLSVYHSLNELITRFAVHIPPLRIQSDEVVVRQRESHGQLRDAIDRLAQGSEVSPEDLQSVKDTIDSGNNAILATLNRNNQRHEFILESIRRAVEKSNQLQAAQLLLLMQGRSESLVMRHNPNKDVEHADVEQELRDTIQADSESHGSKVFHKKVALKDPGSKSELEHLSLQVIKSLQLAHQIDKDCTLQFGSIAITKYTDGGLKTWMLKEDWVPSIIDCERSSWSLTELWSGGLAIWTIKGFNLEACELRASTAEKSEILSVLYQFRVKGGLDVLICEEPSIIQKAAPRFRDKINIIASKNVEVQAEGRVAFKLQSEAKNVKEAYGKAVEDGMAPSLWLAIFIPIIGARSLSSKFWEQLGHPKTSVRANFKENSTFPNIWRKLHIDEMFLLYMFSIVIQDMMARLWLLLQELLPPLGAVIVVLARTSVFARKQGSKIRGIGSSSFRAASPPSDIRKIGDHYQWLIEQLRPDSKMRGISSSSFCAMSPPHEINKVGDERQGLIEELRPDSHIKGIDLSSFRAASPPHDVKKLNESVYEFYAPSGVPEVEIVLFHGLQFDAAEDAYGKTWLGMDDDWIVWLSKEFPFARIIFISYNSSADKSYVYGKLDMYTLAENLVNDLILDSKSNIGQNCKVVLVGHCLGGLVLKELMLRSNGKKHLLDSGNYDEDIESLNGFLENIKGGVIKEIVLSVIERKSSFKSGNRDRYQGDVQKIDNFLRNTRGLFFYGTPHHGSILSDLTTRVPSTSRFLEYLKILQLQAPRINEEFRQLRYGWRTHGLADGQKTNFKGFNAVAVEEASVLYDMDKFYTAPSSHHFTVCRPRAVNDPAFVELARFINSLLGVGLEISIVLPG